MVLRYSILLAITGLSYRELSHRVACRTLIKAIELIRAQGLKHRIGEPKKFLREMNKLCIEMSYGPISSMSF